MNDTTILIVSDQETTARLLETILQQAEHDVLIAGDAAGAQRLAGQRRIDLVLVEGDEVGPGVVHKLKRLQDMTEFAAKPMIVVTPRDRDDELQQALAVGADDYISLPFSPSVVKARVCAALRTARACEEMRVARQRYHVTARAAECGLWEWDVVQNRLYLTRPMQQLLMLEGPLPGTFDAFLRIIHAEDRVRFQNAVQQHLGGYTDLLEDELRIPTPAGPARWFLCRGQAFRSDKGWAERVVGAFVDVSARKSMETALRDSLRELAEAKASIEEQARQLAEQNDALHEMRVELERKSIQLEFHNCELQQAQKLARWNEGE